MRAAERRAPARAGALDRRAAAAGALVAAAALGAGAGWAHAAGMRAVGAALALILAAAAVAAALALARAFRRPLLVPLPLALGLVVAGAAAGLAAADDPRPRATAATLALALVALVACQAAAALPARTLLVAAGTALGAMAVLALGAAALGLADLRPAAQDGSGRLAWPFEHPNFLGAYMAILLPPALAGAAASRRWPARAALGAAVVVGLVGLGLSQSRAAWLGALIGLVALAALGSARRLVVVGLPVVLVASLPLTIPRLNAPDLGLENPRGDIWGDAWGLFLERPLTGIGIDNLALLASPQEGVFGSPTPYHAHSLYLNAAVEMGVLGLAGIVVLVAAGLIAAGRAAAGATGDRRALGSGLLGAIAALAAAGVLDSTMDDPLSAAAAWAVLGAAAGALAARAGPAPDGLRPPSGDAARPGASGAG